MENYDPFIKGVIEKACSDPKKIVFPEATEPRILAAAKKIIKYKIADVILVGKKDEIETAASENGLDLSDVEVHDTEKSEKFEEYAKSFFELRKHKGITEGEAREVIKKPIYFATMMVKMDDADGLVSGAIHSTGETIKPALQIIKTKPTVSIASSVFFMAFPDKALVFSDCAIVEYPTADELAEIAVESAETASIFGIDPKVGLLSYSTKGSAASNSPKKVINATKLAREIIQKRYGENTSIVVDGELQGDAALVKTVADLKAPGSPVKGEAKVLIFPNLDAGNISYKLVQRLAGATAYGPILQGMAKPVNDLSRGCNPDDVVGITAITVVQAQGMK